MTKTRMIEERRYSHISIPEGSFAGRNTLKLHSEDLLRITTATGRTELCLSEPGPSFLEIQQVAMGPASI